jgi:malonyl-CoA O-methyltransferase
VITQKHKTAASSNIKTSFSKYATKYEKHAHLQNEMSEHLALLLPNEIPERVLEIGCGTGLFTKHLLTHPLKRFVLNDISVEMINFLKSKLILPSCSKVIVGDAENIKFDCVDLIAANAVFQWFRNPSNTLRKLRSYINTEGKLIFSTFGPQTLIELRQISSIDSPALLAPFEQWEIWLKTAGFTIDTSSKTIHKIHYFNTLDLLKNLQQLGTTPIKMTQSGSLRRIIKEYDKNYASSNGVYATWEVYYFSAIK